MLWLMRRLPVLISVLTLASCVQSLNPRSIPATPSGASTKCYVVKQDPTNVKATITFYGWPDNSPPGDQISHPVIHNHAGGDGTYCNPTTFATKRSNNRRIPYGTKLYVPFLKQYFVREDLCAASGPSQGSGSNGCYGLWFDLWIGGNAKSRAHAVIACELKLTRNGEPVILWPRDGMPVAHPGPIYGNVPPPDGSCYGEPEKTI